jgi:hypothetical protein
MKKIVLFITLSFIAFSCDKDKVEENTYSGSSFVSFENITSTSLSIPEDGGAYNLKVTISKEQSSDVNVGINIEVLTPGGVNYTTSSNQVTIPAGQLSANLTITPVNDNLNTSSSVIKVSIASVNPGIIIGLREVGSYEKTITLVNDDCPTRFNIWFGSVNVEDVGYGVAPGTGAATVAGTCDILVVTSATNFVGWSTGAYNSVAHEFAFTPDAPNSPTGTVDIEPTVIGRANFTISGVSTPCDVLYTASFGTYDQTTKIIECDYQIRARRVSDGAVFSLGASWSGTTRIIKP